MEQYQVRIRQAVKLKDYDPEDKGDFEGNKEEGIARLTELNQKLDELQDLLYAEHKNRLLIVLQGMDTSGKDGVIRNVFEQVDPQGIRVANFKAPSPVELDHDYLWRVHAQAPGKGEIVIFNRSHYEDVLIVRVRELAREKVWRKRYAQINEFERMLAEEGTTIVKFYLHISHEEQRLRLLKRLDDPNKRWKFNPGDLGERQLWPAYMDAYEEALSRTSTKWAPWYIVPANRKWYRDLVIAEILVDTLQGLKMSYPQALPDLEQYRAKLDPSAGSRKDASDEKGEAADD